MPPDDSPVVLVVEDEPDVAETYEMWLSDEYEVRHAGDGERALEAIDDSVDVVLLDRMMPGMSGEEVLAELRDRGYDCGVAMVTAVDPDFDIIEMGFDDYVTKPPTMEGLRRTVADLLDRREYTGRAREYYALVEKRSALETEKSPEELQENEAYRQLEADIDRLREQLDGENERLLDDTEFLSSLRELAGETDE